MLLSGNHTTLQVQDASTKASGQTPYLFEANGRLTGWTRSDREPRLELELQAHVPLEFALAGASQCQVKTKQRTLTPTPGGPLALPGIQYFRLQETRAQIQINCPAR